MKAYAITNTGRVRAMNEDAYYLPGPGEHFAAVADGMGGHLAGEVASAMAIELFARRMRAARGLPEDTLRDALECANMAIYHAAARRGQAGHGHHLHRRVDGRRGSLPRARGR